MRTYPADTMETKGPPIHVRFDTYANDWITETARRNKMSKPDLIREIVSEKMAALGVTAPKRRIEYAAKRAPKGIDAAEIVNRSKGRI